MGDDGWFVGPCPSCGKDSDILGDHIMVCGTGGERIVRHNALVNVFIAIETN